VEQPLSVTTDLQRLREHRDYEASEGEEKQQGRLWFRNCKTGCAAFASYEAKVVTAEVLAVSCRECELLPGPGREARMAESAWMLPDAVLQLVRKPYWFVNAVAYLRLMNRTGF